MNEKLNYELIASDLDGTQPGEGRGRRAPGVVEVLHRRADDHGAGTKTRQQRVGDADEVALAAEDQHHTVTLDADEHVARCAARGPAELGRPDVVER